jgi:hypothetical protein
MEKDSWVLAAGKKLGGGSVHPVHYFGLASAVTACASPDRHRHPPNLHALGPRLHCSAIVLVARTQSAGQITKSAATHGKIFDIKLGVHNRFSGLLYRTNHKVQGAPVHLPSYSEYTAAPPCKEQDYSRSVGSPKLVCPLTHLQLLQCLYTRGTDTTLLGRWAAVSHS